MSEKIPVCNFESSKFSMIDPYEVVRILRRHGIEINWADACGECFFFGEDRDDAAKIIRSDESGFVLGMTNEDLAVKEAFDEYFDSCAQQEEPTEDYPFIYSWSAPRE